jgi:hypothetical protein
MPELYGIVDDYAINIFICMVFLLVLAFNIWLQCFVICSSVIVIFFSFFFHLKTDECTSEK